MWTSLFLFVLLFTVDCFLIGVPRDVVKEIKVTNGAPFARWGAPQFCALGSFAVGYSMQIEANQHGHDDTELNSIALHCESKDMGDFGGDITSDTGYWGQWTAPAYCYNEHSHSSTQSFLKGFSLQVEANQGHGDDTAANFIKFKCQDFNNASPSHDIAVHPGHGDYGSYGSWSESCDERSAICGLKTSVERDQHGGDDTALNNVMFYCCSE